MFTARLNHQPSITKERREALFVYASQKYGSSARAKVTKDGEEIANVEVRSFDDSAVFRFPFAEFKPPFGVEIIQDGKVVDTGTIDQIERVY